MFVLTTAQGQVTIGSLEKPAPGALLELKNIKDSQNPLITANGGLLLPRVDLLYANSLEPSVIGGGNDTEKLAHIGLILYNTNTVDVDNLCPVYILGMEEIIRSLQRRNCGRDRARAGYIYLDNGWFDSKKSNSNLKELGLLHCKILKE